MAISFGLNLYSIRLHKRNNPKIEFILSDFGAKQDFLDVVEGTFNKWKFDKLSEIKESQTSEKTTEILKIDSEKVVKIKQKPDGTFAFYRTGRMIDGVIMYGESGTSEPVVDSVTGKYKYTKGKEDAPLKPFFFKFYIPLNSTVGFLIIENIGSIGISTIVQNAIINHFAQKDNNAILRILPIGITELADKAIAKSGGVKRITLRGIKNSSFNVDRMIGDGVTNNDCAIDYVIKPKSKRFSSNLFRRLKSTQNSSTRYYEIDGNDVSDISVTMDIDGRERTLSVGQFTRLGSNIDVTSKIVKEDNGYPTFDSLNDQAMDLISLLQKQYDLK